MPQSLRAWRDVLVQAVRRMSGHRVSVIAAGVAFYALLALFPGLAALVALYGLAFEPEQVTQQVARLEGVLPPDALQIVLGQLRSLTGHNRTALSLGALAALLFTLWSASRAVKTVIEALNFAYETKEDRGFFRLNGLALALTLGIIVGAGVAVLAVVAIPVVLNVLDLGGALARILSYARWPLLAAVVVLGLGALYRYGPSCERAHAPWISAGTIVATLLWIAASFGFSIYVENFGRYNQTYGSVGAVVILLTWFLLSAYVILAGAEVDAVLEKRARRV